MQGDIQRVLIDRRAIAQRVEQIAQKITADLCRLYGVADPAALPDDADLTLVPILTGSIIFVADLIRHLPMRIQIRLISVSSYAGKTTVSKQLKIQAELSTVPASLTGAHVLVIDDILDSGKTLRAVTGLIRDRGAASIKTCVLLRKDRPEAMSFPIDYFCFDIPDEFVVGYGLDYNDYYRNLPEIVTLKAEVTRA